MAYYRRHNEIPSIPTYIKDACITIGMESLKSFDMSSYHRNYEYNNKNSISYIEQGNELKDKLGKQTGGVGFCRLPVSIINDICNFYKKINNPLINFNNYKLQLVFGGTFVSPHIDDPMERTSGLIYLIKSGGDNVRTRWHGVKDQYKNLELTVNTEIPVDRLDLVEDHCLEEDAWHWLNFNKIHSVENQESLRLALWGLHL